MSAERDISWLHFLAYFSTDLDEIGCGVEAIQVDYPDFVFE